MKKIIARWHFKDSPDEPMPFEKLPRSTADEFAVKIAEALNDARALPRKARLTGAEKQRRATDKRVREAWNYYAKRKLPEHNRAAKMAEKIKMSESVVRESINRQRLRSK